MYNKISKIVELVDKVPSNLKDEVFLTLLNAAKSDNANNLYENEIIKLTENGKLLKEFVKQKKPQSNIERTLLFVYYLEKKRGLEVVDAEQIEECYKLAGIDIPGNLSQNLRDTSSSRYKYIKSVRGGFKVTPKGEEFCENDE